MVENTAREVAFNPGSLKKDHLQGALSQHGTDPSRPEGQAGELNGRGGQPILVRVAAGDPGSTAPRGLPVLGHGCHKQGLQCLLSSQNPESPVGFPVSQGRLK